MIILHHGRIVCDRSLRALQNAEGLRLRAEIQGDKKRLLPALRTLPGVRGVTALPDAAPGVVSMLLDCDQPPEKALFDLLCGLHMPLLRLQEAQSSLEEIFLRLTAEG